MMANKELEKAKKVVLAKAMAVDFESMSKAQYDEWMDSLPMMEFMALLHLHDHWARGHRLGLEGIPEDAPAKPARLEPGDNDWIPYNGSGECPVDADTIVFLLWGDGDVIGPNHADKFFWEAENPLAYAIVPDTRLIGEREQP